MENLKFELANIDDLNKIMLIYKDVIKNTFTTWNELYPAIDIIAEDISNKSFYVLKNDKEIVAVSYLGVNENEDENWKYKLQNPLGIARICVSTKYQHKGIGTQMLKLLINQAKTLGADGLHFHVATINTNAIKMYEKVGFKNCGLGKSNYGFDFYKFELKF